MPLDISKIPTLTPSQFFTFTVPNALLHDCHLRSPLLRLAVLDSPRPPPPPPDDDDVPLVAALIVPPNRESDWIFSTEAGQFQILLSYSNVARLVLIGNNPQPNSPPSPFIRPPATDSDDQDREKLEEELKSLVVSLHPTVCFQDGMLPEPEFLRFEDPTLYSVILNRFMGRLVGEFLVEDVEVERRSDNKKEFRRRLRFKRMPKTIQSEIPLVPTLSEARLANLIGVFGMDLPGLRKMDEVEFRIDPTVLVHRYLIAMVSGISLITTYLDQRIRHGFVPRALCLGVGGGALLSFLKSQLGFHVVGVESDEVVMNVGRRYFGLVDSISLQLVLGDAAEFLEKFARGLARRNPQNLPVSITMKDAKYDAIMVDLDAGDAGSGIGGPPPSFVRRSVFQSARSLLHDQGVMVINVAPSDGSYYDRVILELRTTFNKVYEINVENEENYILVATVAPEPSDVHDNEFATKLKCAILGAFIDSINEI